jgi:hypothetical protein
MGPRRAPPSRPLPEQASLCRACGGVLTWESIVRLDREIQPRVFERAFVCPHCRAVQEFASWQTGTSRKP